MAGAEAAEDLALPWKSLGESSTHTKRSSNVNTKCVVHLFLMSHHFCIDKPIELVAKATRAACVQMSPHWTTTMSKLTLPGPRPAEARDAG